MKDLLFKEASNPLGKGESKLFRRVWHWGPVVLYTVFIFWLSSAPRPVPGIELFPWMDKVLHAIEFTPYGSLLARAIRRSQDRLSWGWVEGLAFLAAFSVGSLDEYYQSFVDTRSSSLFDLFWDCVGAALGSRFYRRGNPRGKNVGTAANVARTP